MIKALAKAVLGDVVLGRLDYMRFPQRGVAWGGPFNGQPARVALFEALVRACKPAAIVETGTFLGTTTELFAQTMLPVYTVEARARWFGFARQRFRHQQNVDLRMDDSRAFLRAVFDGPLKRFGDAPLFAYLDAHWQQDIPLAEEIDIIFSHCPAAVVMVDDFQVPFDPGYGYDDYGGEDVLSADLIAPAVGTRQLQLFYPSTPSGEDGGARRGCVVLAKAGEMSRRLAAISLLSGAEKPL